MQQLINKLMPFILVMLGVMLLLSGCSKSTSSTATASIQTTADPIMQNILVSLDTDDYAGFSRDFSQTAANTLNQAAFNSLYSQIQTGLGNYKSKLFMSNTVQSGFNTVIYIAQYSKEPAGVSVSLVLQASGGGYQVQGLNFDSPNLRGQPIDVPSLLAYASSETENVLLSLNNNNYTAFSKDLDQVVKNAIPQSGFNSLYNQLKSNVGDYQSKAFEAASLQNNIYTVIYLAQYTDEPSGVWVTISFDSSQKIAGLYFISPKLQQAQ